MGSHWRVMNQNRLVALKATVDSEQIFNFTSPHLQGGHEPMSIRHNRKQTTRQLSSFRIASFTNFTILAASSGFWYFAIRKLLFLHLCHECDPGQMLPESIVQSLDRCGAARVR